MADDPRFADNAARVANRAEIIAVVQQALGHLTGVQARELLERNSLVVGVVRNFAQVLESEDVRASGVFQPTVDQTGERLLMPTLPYRFSTSHASDGVALRSPSLGEHADEVLTEAGFDAQEITRLRACGAVGAPQAASR